jgi:hypothetical protein
MRGILLTEKKADLWSSVTDRSQIRMLMACLSVGIIAGLGVTHVHLNLGIPGHKAWFWIPPIMAARFITRCRIGATAGALRMLCTTWGLGGHLAGGLIGMPFIGMAAMVWDVMIGHLEKPPLRWFVVMPSLVGLAVMGNALAFGKRLLVPSGMHAIHIWGFTGPWFSFVSYLICGLMAGVATALIVYSAVRKKAESQ